MTTGVRRVMRRVTPQQTDESIGTGNGGLGVCKATVSFTGPWTVITRYYIHLYSPTGSTKIRKTKYKKLKKQR